MYTLLYNTLTQLLSTITTRLIYYYVTAKVVFGVFCWNGVNIEFLSFEAYWLFFARLIFSSLILFWMDQTGRQPTLLQMEDELIIWDARQL